ncbi:MAG: ATP-dependent Clp protease adapter ClpS [bacterium]|nr:ATP-dependent Clp protease adapter ClpS [bacterium]
MGREDTIFEGDIKLESEKKLEEPRMFKVLLHNDHYTTMEFVVEVLTKVFHMPAAKATQVMLDVHKKGTGTCGVFTRDVAVTKVNQVQHLAKAREFPLKCSYEEA